VTGVPLLAVTMGDAAGIGPEIALRLVAAPPRCARLLLLGSRAALERELVHVPGARVPATVDDVADVPAAAGSIALWAGAAPLHTLPAHGRVAPAAGAASHAWVLQAADLALEGAVAGVVTGPIHKEAWHAAGVRHPGHTEALRDHAGAERVLMMLIGGRLRVALATIHVPLRLVPSLLAPERLAGDLVLLAAETARAFGPERPRIAVCGLNPHAGEGGLFGDEEAAVIAPAVATARARGVDAHGPLPADGCIPAAVGGAYDAVFAMYHDQALPAVKSVAQRRGVNITLGLPFVRTSVDHGTAFDRAGTGRATASSLEAAVRAAAAVATRRAEIRPSSAGRDRAHSIRHVPPPT